VEGNKVKVTIFGQTYTINGEAPREYILQLAEYLNGKMEEVCIQLRHDQSDSSGHTGGAECGGRILPA